MKNLSDSQLTVPIVIFAYNRPQLLNKVLSAVKQISPQTLYLVVDGVADKNSENLTKNQQVKDICDRVDWCENIYRNYSVQNLGCGIRISTGLDWVFTQEKQAIILEDDCLVHPCFFHFCQELLNYYKDDFSVTQICGTNRLLRWREKQQSYHFARYGSAWGWATWRRAWQRYHDHEQLWKNVKIRGQIEQLIANQEQYNYFCQRYQQALINPKITWDYQWSLVQLAQAGKSIIPAVNLVKNIGFNEDATHTSHFCLSHLLQAAYSLEFPLVHPSSLEYDDEYDRQHFAWSIGKSDIDSLIVMINTLIAQKKWIHSLLVLNQAVIKYPQSQPLKDIRLRVLFQLKNKK